METNDLSQKSKVAVAVFNPNSENGIQIAQNALTQAVGSYTGVAAGDRMHFASADRTLFEDVSTNISVRNEFTRKSYESFRPSESVPVKPKDIMSFSNQAYRRVGLVRNIVDLMGDFTVQGVNIVHPDKKQQKLYRAWWKKVRGKHVSERFANYLYRLGNVVVQRWTAKLGKKAKKLMSAMGAKLEATEELDAPLQTRKGVIPSRYNFLNPMTIEIAGGALGQFVGEQVIALALPANLRNQILHPRDELERALVAKIPNDIRVAAQSGKQFYILDGDKIVVSHYKKDDWQTWADPIAYAAMDDLILLEKMKLADLAALDGAISQVRVWTLGDLDQGIIPTDEAINKLADILLSNPGGGAFDLIWGPDLKVDSVKTDVHQFLGSTKYEPVLNSLYETFGVPGTLTGNSSMSGTTNNFISMQTLVERLNYGRGILTAFWEQEIELFRQAMGLKPGAKVVFDQMTLTDKAAEKGLLKSLYEIDLISDETLLERFGEDDAVEMIRKKREKKERESGKRNPKAGAFFTAEKEHEYTKMALQRGYINPEDAGLEDLTPDKKSPFDRQLETMIQKNAQSGKPGDPSKKVPGKNGRPAGKKDGPGGRKERSFKVRTAADSIEDTASFLTQMTWAKQVQDVIADKVNPVMLSHFGKDSMRSLSKKETAAAERMKFKVLASLSPFEEVTDDVIARIAANNKPLPLIFNKCHSAFVSQLKKNNGREPNIDEMRSVQAAVYSLLWEQVN
jgi:hypothetical protein